MLQKNLPFLRALWVISARMWFDLAALIHFMVKGKFRDAWAVSRAHQRFFLDLFKTARKRTDRKSVVKGKSVSVRVDLGGRRIIKKKKNRINPLDNKTRQ